MSNVPESDTAATPVPDRLLAYLAARDERRLDAAAGKWTALTEREQQLVREAAVLAFVHGTQLGISHAHSGRGGTPPIPGDRDIVVRVLSDVSMFPDLYPTLASLSDATTDNDEQDD